MSKSYYLIAKEEAGKYGVCTLGIKDLLAIIIGPQADMEICSKLALLPASRLSAISMEELLEMGLSKTAAQKLAACFRLNSLMNIQAINGEIIGCPQDAAKALSFIKNEEQEHMVVMHLNTKNKIIKKLVISKGTINSTICRPREIFKAAIRENVAAILLGHNHPSGDPSPSMEDIELTKKIKEAGDVLGIKVLDHVIVAGERFCSLKEVAGF